MSSFKFMRYQLLSCPNVLHVPKLSGLPYLAFTTAAQINFYCALVFAP